jgi:hypothetical protein
MVRYEIWVSGSYNSKGLDWKEIQRMKRGEQHKVKELTGTDIEI